MNKEKITELFRIRGGKMKYTKLKLIKDRIYLDWTLIFLLIAISILFLFVTLDKLYILGVFLMFFLGLVILLGSFIINIADLCFMYQLKNSILKRKNVRKSNRNPKS